MAKEKKSELLGKLPEGPAAQGRGGERCRKVGPAMFILPNRAARQSRWRGDDQSAA